MCALVAIGCAAAVEPSADAASTDVGSSASEGGAMDDAAPFDAGPRRPVGARCTPEAVPSAGFVAAEVYVETTSPMCADGPCEVFHLVGDPYCVTGECLSCGGASDCGSACAGACVVSSTGAEPNSLARTFCSCRCSAAGNPGLPLCTCPSGMSCVPDTDPGGGYCAPDALIAGP